MSKLNPDSIILAQLDGHWQRLAALIIWKLAGRDKPVEITAADIDAYRAAFAPGEGILFTHGRDDSIGLSLIDEASARRLAAHDATLKGTA